MKHLSLKLLLSARDPGTANNMIQIAKTAIDSDKFEIIFYADEPAYSMIQRERIPVERFHAGFVLSRNDPGVEGLHKEAIEIIKKVQPDVVLAGTSSPGAGIDEALLANTRNIHSYVIQDFWGRVNNLFGVNNATYFVIDEEAAQLSHKLHQVETIVTGMPKYAGYKSIDTVSVRKRLRNILCHKPDERIITFIGQDLWHLKGYHKTLKKFAETVSDLGISATVLYCKHPKEPESCMREVSEIMSSVEVAYRPASEFTIVECLVASDIVCCVSSFSGYDQIMLNRVSSEPLGVVVFLLFEPDLIGMYKELFGISYLPPVKNQYAFCVGHSEQLDQVLKESLYMETQQRNWQIIQNSTPMPDSASINILNNISISQRQCV